MDDSDKWKEKWRQEKQLLEEIRNEKLKELEKAGVPAKYRAELQKFKI